MRDLNYDFRAPLELTEIFRQYETAQPTEIETDPGSGNATMTAVVTGLGEYATRKAILWCDICSINQYAYKDEWQRFKGPKYNLKTYTSDQPILVLGDYQTMLDYWTAYLTQDDITLELTEKDQ